MTPLEDAVTELLANAPRAKDVDLLKDGSARRRRKRRRIIGASAAVVGLALIAVAIAVHDPSEPQVAVSSGTDASSGASTAPEGPLSAHIELASASISAGASEVGYLVIENHTGAALQFTTHVGNRCAPQWSVVLRNEKVPQVAMWRSVCRFEPLV